MKARAVVFTEKLQVEVQDIEVPEAGPDQVLIDVEYSWISIGTESSFLRKERIEGDKPWREGDRSPFPMVPGYQKVGTVTAVGSGVEGLAVGDRVFATVSAVGPMAYADGGHVNPAVTHRSQVWKLPEGANPVAYSGMVLTQVGYNCGIRPPVHPGACAVVIGDGLVGQWAAQTLLHRGAGVTVLGRHEARLRCLPEAVRRVNTRRQPLEETLAGLAGQIHIVVDTVGDMEAIRALQPHMLRDSHLVSAGFYGEKGWLDIQSIRDQEITLHCPSGWVQARMDATLEGIRDGWLQTESLITHRFPAGQAAEAWKVIQDPEQICLGVILEWQAAESR